MGAGMELNIATLLTGTEARSLPAVQVKTLLDEIETAETTFADLFVVIPTPLPAPAPLPPALGAEDVPAEAPVPEDPAIAPDAAMPSTLSLSAPTELPVTEKSDTEKPEKPERPETLAAPAPLKAPLVPTPLAQAVLLLQVAPAPVAADTMTQSLAPVVPAPAPPPPRSRGTLPELGPLAPPLNLPRADGDAPSLVAAAPITTSDDSLMPILSTALSTVPSDLDIIAPPIPEARAEVVVEQTRLAQTTRDSAVQTSAPPASPTAAQAVDVARQIEAAISRSRDGALEIALSPEELGRLRLTLSEGQNGYSLQVVTDRPDTLDLLRRHIDVLAAELRDLGYGTLDLSFQQQGQGDAHTPYGGQGAENADAAPQIVTLRPRSDGQLDMRM